MRSPAQQAQAKRINPYVPRRRRTSVPVGPTESWWTNLPPAEFYAEAKRRDAQRQQQMGRVVYPDRNDRWDVA